MAERRQRAVILAGTAKLNLTSEFEYSLEYAGQCCSGSACWAHGESLTDGASVAFAGLARQFPNGMPHKSIRE